jgi:hypothetical protein
MFEDFTAARWVGMPARDERRSALSLNNIQHAVSRIYIT